MLCDDVPTKLNGVMCHKTGIFVGAPLELQSSPVFEQIYSTLACEMFGYFTLCVVQAAQVKPVASYLNTQCVSPPSDSPDSSIPRGQAALGRMIRTPARRFKRESAAVGIATGTLINNVLEAWDQPIQLFATKRRKFVYHLTHLNEIRNLA